MHSKGDYMKRNFLTQYLSKISNFPAWAKEIIYNKLSEDITDDNPSFIFASYKPVLSYRGRCELDFQKSGFDTNIYNILDSCDMDCSISEIMVNTFLSLEETAKCFLFCLDEGLLEIPDDSQILNIAGFLSGKYKTGEFFVNNGTISQSQLDNVVSEQENSNSDKKFGQYLIDLGIISQKQLDIILNIKEEAKKRFILDYHEVPQVSIHESDEDKKQIEDLKQENKQLRAKLEQLLTIVRNKND